MREPLLLIHAVRNLLISNPVRTSLLTHKRNLQHRLAYRRAPLKPNSRVVAVRRLRANRVVATRRLRVSPAVAVRRQRVNPVAVVRKRPVRLSRAADRLQ